MVTMVTCINCDEQCEQEMTMFCVNKLCLK